MFFPKHVTAFTFITGMNRENNLQRFIDAQETSYEAALSEIKNGRKKSHWMWYIFPQFMKKILLWPGNWSGGYVLTINLSLLVYCSLLIISKVFMSSVPLKNFSKNIWKTGLIFKDENNVIYDFNFKSSGLPKILLASSDSSLSNSLQSRTSWSISRSKKNLFHELTTPEKDFVNLIGSIDRLFSSSFYSRFLNKQCLNWWKSFFVFSCCFMPIIF